MLGGWRAERLRRVSRGLWPFRTHAEGVTGHSAVLAGVHAPVSEGFLPGWCGRSSVLLSGEAIPALSSVLNMGLVLLSRAQQFPEVFQRSFGLVGPPDLRVSRRVDFQAPMGGAAFRVFF